MEPMGSFAEWKCGACGVVRNVPTREVEAVKQRELAPLVELTGWAIHSFGHECAKLVSPDYQHTQVIDLAFAEALRGKLPKTLPADASARK